MAIPTRLIRRRLKSVRSTRKIMKAMELVAASKMRKAVGQALASRPYASLLQEMAQEARRWQEAETQARVDGVENEKKSELARALYVIIASDRGLCGGFNHQLIKVAIQEMRKKTDVTDLVIVGRKAELVARRTAGNVIASFPSIANAPSFERVRPLVQLVSEAYLSGRASTITFVYTHFKSALSQEPTVAQIFPIISTDATVPQTVQQSCSSHFEPSPQRVLDALVPKMVETRIYQYLLESAASEHSSRMMAMRSAGDAASDMIDSLTFTLNQARQAAITQEISEISAGKAAIE